MFKNIGKNIKSVGIGTVGAVGAKVVTNKLVPMIPGLGSNEILKSAVPVAAGLLLMEMKGDFMQDLGFGMGVAGLADAVTKHVPGIGEITGDDVSGAVDAVIEGIDKELDEIMKVSEELGALSPDATNPLNEELSEELSEQLSEEVADDFQG